MPFSINSDLTESVFFNNLVVHLNFGLCLGGLLLLLAGGTNKNSTWTTGWGGSVKDVRWWKELFVLEFSLPLSYSDITLRYKETRRRKQEVPTDRDRPLGNGSTATPSGRSKLNGSSETVRQRKS